MATLTGQQNICRNFSGELEMTLRRFGKSSNFFIEIFPMIIRLFQHQRQSRKTLEIIRAAIDLCVTDCKQAPCLTNIYGDVKLVRDSYIKLLDIISQFPVFSILRHHVEDTLSEWDDLVEDCVIGSDDEFRDLIRQISEKF